MISLCMHNKSFSVERRRCDFWFIDGNDEDDSGRYKKNKVDFMDEMEYNLGCLQKNFKRKLFLLEFLINKVNERNKKFKKNMC